MRLGLSILAVTALVLLTCASFLTAGWQHPPMVTTQNGYRGTGMDQIVSHAQEDVLKYSNTLPAPIAPAAPGGDSASKSFKNVKVLTDLTTGQFIRVMLSITEWVAPKQGCTYCHAAGNFADDSLYTKVVARRMLQMTRHINTDWKQHVDGVGVTCYTCHRGQPVPEYIWFNDPHGPHAGGFAALNNGMGHPSVSNGTTTMPFDPFTTHLEGKDSIRVESTSYLPDDDKGASVQDAESTYALMMHISESLGVNCTFCHNAQAFLNWSQSTPQRVTAWWGIQMVRDLNGNYLDSLKSTFPEARLGPHGDNPKLNCATCHQGVNKPLYGISMAKSYPELGGQPSP
jgi:photosynthetic reaction center cytochrome c subunit